MRGDHRPLSPGVMRPDPAKRRSLRRSPAPRRRRREPEVHQVPVGRQAIIAGILAHRRDEDAVLEGDAANLERREKLAHVWVFPVKLGGKYRTWIAPASAAKTGHAQA